MLGFSTLSQAPLSQAIVAVAALGYVAGVASAGSITATGFDAKAETVAPSAVSTTAVALEDADAQAVTGTGSVFATHGVDAFTDVYGQASTVPTSVDATFTANTVDTTALANVTFSSILLDASLDPVESDAAANSYITTVALSSVLSDFYVVEGIASTSLFNVSANFETSIETPTAVQFPYRDFADSYSRNRTAYLISRNDNGVVYITKL